MGRGSRLSASSGSGLWDKKYCQLASILTGAEAQFLLKQGELRLLGFLHDPSF